MTVIGFHASHEQIHPARLLEAVQQAEQVGFTAAMSYAADEQTALRTAHEQWRTNVFDPPVCWDLDHVALFDEAAKHVPPEAMHGPVLVSSDPGRHVAWLVELVEIGFDEV